MDFLRYIVLQDIYPVLEPLLSYLEPTDIAALMIAMRCHTYSDLIIKSVSPLRLMGLSVSEITSILEMSHTVLVAGPTVEGYFKRMIEPPTIDDHKTECFKNIVPKSYWDISFILIPKDVQETIKWLTSVGARFGRYICCIDDDAPRDTYAFDETCDDDMRNFLDGLENMRVPPLHMMFIDARYGGICAYSMHDSFKHHMWDAVFSAYTDEKGFQYIDIKRSHFKVRRTVKHPTNMENNVVSIPVSTIRNGIEYIPIELC